MYVQSTFDDRQAFHVSMSVVHVRYRVHKKRIRLVKTVGNAFRVSAVRAELVRSMQIIDKKFVKNIFSL